MPGLTEILAASAVAGGGHREVRVSWQGTLLVGAGWNPRARHPVSPGNLALWEALWAGETACVRVGFPPSQFSSRLKASEASAICWMCSCVLTTLGRIL